MNRQKPGLTRQNYLDVYEHCRNQKPSKSFVRLGYAALDAIYRVNVDYAEGAQEDLERIDHDGLPHIYAFNHLTTDHYVVGSVLHQVAPQDVGNIRVLGNDITLRHVQKLSDAVGAIPVARRIDHDDPETVELCKDELVNCCEDIMLSGYKLSIHPEGDTNRKDPIYMGKVKQGAALIALRMAPSAITPIGYTYGPDNLSKPRKGHVFAHVEPTIFVNPGDTVEQTTRRIGDSLQHAVFLASAYYL